MSIRSLGDVVHRSGSCVTVPEDANVYTLAESLAQARVDACAVLCNATNRLAGVATSRDVAKCVARGEDLHLSKVSEVMMAHPITLPPAETPANALALMREGGFRHIPVVSEEDGSVMGIVDVLSLAYDAITRLQVSYSMIPTRRGFEFMRAARENMEKPTLRPIVEKAPVATMLDSCSVTDACETFVREHLTAIVVVDGKGVLDGIFTCSDVVNRVVMAHRNPVKTELIDVMTTNPDCAAPDFTILESLQRMQACGFRHLPVVETHTRVVVGLVDVLQLASTAISGLATVAEQSTKPHASVEKASSARGQVRGFTSIFSSLFSSSYTPNDYEEVEVGMDGLPVQPEPAPLPAAFTRSGPVSRARRQASFVSELSSSSSRYRGIPNDVKLASFKFKDLNNEYRKIKVPMTFEPGAFDMLVVNVRRRFAGASCVGPIKIKYVDEDHDEVLISNDDDLFSCFEDFADSKSKTIHLRVTALARTSSSQIQSPVSSTPSSAIGSPRNQSLSPIERQETQGIETSPELPAVSERKEQPGMRRTISRQVAQSPSMQKVAEAQKLMLDGKMEDAIHLYEEALRLDPNNPRAQGGRAATRLLNGNSTGAEEDYRAAIAMVDGGKGEATDEMTLQMCIIGLVESLIDQRRYEEAVTVAGRIDPSTGVTGCMDAFRDELDSASNAARQALEAGEFGDAMSCYSNALRVEAGYLQLMPTETGRASLRLGRAKCYKALEDYDMALEDYEAAVMLEPESVAGHKGCGKCFAELEQMDRALESYERAHKLDPADDEVTKEIEVIKGMLPDPLQEKKDEIKKLGALLGGLGLIGKK